MTERDMLEELGFKPKSEAEMQQHIIEHIQNWKPGYSKDGMIAVCEKEFAYKNVAYRICVLRHFDHTNKFTPMSSRLTSYHANVEYPDQTKPLVEAVSALTGYSGEFLYHDSLHSWNDIQSLKEQIEAMHKSAQRDIDNIPQIIKDAQEKILKQNDEITKLQVMADGIK